DEVARAALARPEREGGEAGVEARGVGVEAAAAAVALIGGGEPQAGEGGGGDRGGQRGRVDEAAGPVEEEGDQLPAARDVGAERPERLAERAHLEVDAETGGEAATALAEHTGRVRLVDDEERAVAA